MKTALISVLVFLVSCSGNLSISVSDSRVPNDEVTNASGESTAGIEKGGDETQSGVATSVSTESGSADSTLQQDPPVNPLPEPAPAPAPDPSPPVKVLNINAPGVPSGTSTLSTISTVINGDYMTFFRWAFMAQTENCVGATFGSWIAAGTTINIPVGFPGLKRLCIEAESNEVETNVVNQFDWTSNLPHDFDLANTTHLSVDAPLLLMKNDNTDCLSKLSDNIDITVRPASSAIINNDIAVFTPCNKPTVGWTMARADWDGNSSTGNWVDTNTGTSAYDGLFSLQSLSQNGVNKVANIGMLTLAQKSDNKIFGYYLSTGPGPSGSLAIGIYPYEDSVVGQVRAAAIYTTKNWWAVTTTGEWNSSFSFPEVAMNVQPDNQTSLYFVTKDISNNYYVGTMNFPGNDLRLANTFPSTYLAMHYRLPKVRNIGGTWYFIGYHTQRKKIELVLGTGPETFDWANPRTIDLDTFMTIPGWYSTIFQIEPGVDLPNIFGFEIKEVAGIKYAFLLYRGGDFSNKDAVTVRGIGVFRIPLMD